MLNYIYKKTEIKLVKDLSYRILTLPGMELTTMALNKEWNSYFNAKMKARKENPVLFENFLIEYCDVKLTTNPRWAYYAYKIKGDKPEALARYKAQAEKDIPWKHTLITWAMSSIFTRGCRGVQNQWIALAITGIYFLLTHVITIKILHIWNHCTNVKNLFYNMALAIIIMNLIINIGVLFSNR